jgi:predicted transcriptional regulator
MGRPRLGDLELAAMKCVWRRGRATVHEVREDLDGPKELAYTTVLTTLRNLEKKGYLTHETDGRSHVYVPLVAEEDVERKSLRRLIDKVFDGSPAKLVNALFGDPDLTEAEVEELRRRIEELRGKEEGDG